MSVPNMFLSEWKHFPVPDLISVWQPWGKPGGGAWAASGLWTAARGLNDSVIPETILNPNSLLSGSTQLYKPISSITSHYHTVHPELWVSTLPRKWKTLVGWTHPWWCFSFSFLLSLIAFLSGWIYEELRGPGSSPCLQKKKEKTGSMKLQSILRFEWWESFVSFIFCYPAD